jgi:cytochrome c553
MMVTRHLLTRGGQSTLMWSQAAALDDVAIAHLAAYIETL